MIRKAARFIEEWVASLAIILIVSLCTAESVLRLFWHTGIPSSQPVMVHLLLVAGCVSGMLATRKKEHLSVGLIHYLKNEKLINIFSIVCNSLAALTSIVLTACSAVFIRISLNPPSLIGFLPDRFFAAALPLAFAVMAYRFARAVPLYGLKRLFVLVPVLAGLVFALPMIFKLVWEFDLPEYAYEMNELFVNAALALKVPIIFFLVLAALAGTPLFIVLASFSLLLFTASGWETDTIIVNVYAALTTSDYISIPLFTLVGFFLSESRAGERLVETFKSLLGWFHGGLIIVSIVLCAFFTTFTGASGVTILALGGILYAILSENAKYPPHFSRGLLTSSGSIGLLFPPSLPLILVAITMQRSILDFFAAGAIPGIILTLATIVFGIIISIKTKIPLEKFDIKRVVVSIRHSIFELLLPIILVGGFVSGVLSLVEIGGAALLYVFVVEVFITRDIKLSRVGAVFAKAMPIIGGILSILALSKALSDYIVFTQAPETFADFLQNAISSKWVFLLFLNGALLVAGCLMDIFSATVVVLPLIAPLAAVYNIDPIHLGIIFLVNLEAGYLTPPVGLNLFLASYRFKKPFVEICRDVFPFLLIQLAVVLLITYVPEFSTILPNLSP